MENKKCVICGQELPEMYVSHCSWNCSVEDAKRGGGVIHQPNGLPIQCIRHDGSLWEHEHADHSDYKFPVEIEYTGEKPQLPEWDDSYGNETHALIYADGFIAVTIHECCYMMWHLADRSYMGGRSAWYNNKWKLTIDSRDKILEFCKNKIKQD